MLAICSLWPGLPQVWPAYKKTKTFCCGENNNRALKKEEVTGTHMHAHTCMLRHAHTRARACAHTHTHVCMHTLTCTHTHTHTHMQCVLSCTHGEKRIKSHIIAKAALKEQIQFHQDSNLDCGRCLDTG